MPTQRLSTLILLFSCAIQSPSYCAHYELSGENEDYLQLMIQEYGKPNSGDFLQSKRAKEEKKTNDDNSAYEISGESKEYTKAYCLDWIKSSVLQEIIRFGPTGISSLLRPRKTASLELMLPHPAESKISVPNARKTKGVITTALQNLRLRHKKRLQSKEVNRDLIIEFPPVEIRGGLATCQATLGELLADGWVSEQDAQDITADPQAPITIRIPLDTSTANSISTPLPFSHETKQPILSEEKKDLPDQVDNLEAKHNTTLASTSILSEDDEKRRHDNYRSSYTSPPRTVPHQPEPDNKSINYDAQVKAHFAAGKTVKTTYDSIGNLLQLGHIDQEQAKKITQQLRENPKNTTVYCYGSSPELL